mgnify:CR=1 FL=1
MLSLNLETRAKYMNHKRTPPHTRSNRRFSNNKRRPQQKKRQHGQYINPAKFVNKVAAPETQEAYAPTHTFADFDVHETLKANILAKKFTTPTPIQDQAIPHILEGKDVVGIANTGTGKTAAFLIPLINKVLTHKDEQVLIIAPTRELAIQIEEELKNLAYNLRLFSVCAVGGAPIFKQIKQLQKPNQFIIGTPGRIKDLVERKKIHLNHFNTLVLDEADRMLDMGFVDDMRFIAQNMKDDRHTLFFSATMSKEIEKLINAFLTDPVHISVKTGDTAKNVEQDVVKVRKDNKTEALHDLLIQKDFTKVIVFAATKRMAENLARDLTKRGFTAESIHGDKTHGQRQRALKKFKTNESQVLVATDVAARGLDIDQVSHVINYDVPQTYDDYVHRIGRTGRGENRGKALTFVH